MSRPALKSVSREWYCETAAERILDTVGQILASDVRRPPGFVPGGEIREYLTGHAATPATPVERALFCAAEDLLRLEAVAEGRLIPCIRAGVVTYLTPGGEVPPRGYLGEVRS